MLELAKKLIELTGSRSELERKLVPKDDPKQRQPDINLAKQLLGWLAIIKLKEKLKLNKA